MKKRTGMIVVGICLLLGVGGKIYMNQEKDKKELLVIQQDLANYIYNNYVLVTADAEKEKQIFKEFNKGKGSLTEKQFFKKLDEIKEIVDIEKIEFTEFKVGAMNSLEVYFTINNVYKEEVDLDTKSAETNKFIYNITNGTGDGPYYIEEKEEKTKLFMPEKTVVYYEGGIDE